MFEQFTERARKVMSLSRQDAQDRNAEFIGTENILCGIIREGDGVANKMLKWLNTPPEAVRAEVDRLMKEHQIEPAQPLVRSLGQLPFSPRAKRVIELSGEAASQLGHDVVGTEHILIGLRKEREGIAAQVLENLKITLDMLVQALAAVVPPTEEAGPKPETVKAGLTKYGRLGPVFKTPNGTLLTLAELLSLQDHQVVTSLDIKKLVWGEDAKS
jgi:ATP-dependent Clp protease ATP-binding subunit ClpC